MDGMIPNDGERFVREFRTNAARLAASGIDFAEHDACGVGFVADLHGRASRSRAYFT